MCQERVYDLWPCPTEKMKADIFTKAFTDKNKWDTRIVEINHWIPNAPSLPYKAVVTPKESKAIEKLTQELESGAAERPANANLSLDRKRCPPNRTIIEYCCGEESLIGQVSRFKEARGCEVVRITEKLDGRSELAKKLMNDTINSVPGYSLLLFSAMPCTGGSPWQYLNIKKPGVAAKVRRHWKLFRELWVNFTWAAEKVLEAGVKL